MSKFRLFIVFMVSLLFLFFTAEVSFAGWSYENGKAKVCKEKSKYKKACIILSKSDSSQQKKERSEQNTDIDSPYLMQFQTMGEPSAEYIKLEIDNKEYFLNNFIDSNSKEVFVLTINTYSVYVNSEVVDSLKTGDNLEVKFATDNDWGNPTYYFTIDGNKEPISKALK